MDDDTTEVHRDLAQAYQRFSFGMESFRQLLSVVVPFAAEQGSGESTYERLKDTLRASTTDDEFTAIFDQMRELADALKEAAEAADNIAEEKSGIVRQISVDPRLVEILMPIIRTTFRPKPVPLLLQSMIPVAVGMFEVLVGDLVRVTYRTHQGALGATDKEFSLQELLDLGDISAALDVAIERRTDRLLRGNLDEWMKWFNSPPLKIDLPKLTHRWSDVVEVFQRRHIIVHNAGRISERYIANASGPGAKGLTVGSELSIDSRDVREALESLTALGLLMWAFTARVLVDEPKSSRMTAGSLWQECLQLADEEYWYPIWEIAGMAATFRTFQDRHRHRFRCLHWFAKKQLDGLDAVRAEVKAFDTSALSHDLKAARAAILDEQSVARKELVAALRSGEMTTFEARRSPLYMSIIPLLGDDEFATALTGEPKQPTD